MSSIDSDPATGRSSTNEPSVTDAEAKPQRGRLLLGGVLLAAVVFGLGIGVGDGRLTLHSKGVSGDLPNKLNYSSVDQVYDNLKSEYDGKLDQSKLLDGLKQGLVQAAGDPYTTYFTPDEAKKFDEQLNGNFSGIGAELGQDTDKNLVVIAPIADTPAAKAGIKSQDVIAEINGTSTSGLSVEEAVSKIRGPKGTDVKLTLIRNKSQTIKLTISRDDIQVPTVEAKTLDGNIGYLRVTTFGDSTAAKARDEAVKFKAAGVKGMILDLRGNPGGLVDGAVKISSFWLPKDKLIMQEKRGTKVVNTYDATGDDLLAGIPTEVLIDGGSASASEITAGALHDNGVAKLIGEKSYGKGSVQNVGDTADGGKLKVTIARWYRPNGQNIDKKGIDPEQKVTISDADAAAGRDTQLEAAQAALRR